MWKIIHPIFCLKQLFYYYMTCHFVGGTVLFLKNSYFGYLFIIKCLVEHTSTQASTPLEIGKYSSWPIRHVYFVQRSRMWYNTVTGYKLHQSTQGSHRWHFLMFCCSILKTARHGYMHWHPRELDESTARQHNHWGRTHRQSETDISKHKRAGRTWKLLALYLSFIWLLRR